MLQIKILIYIHASSFQMKRNRKIVFTFISASIFRLTEDVILLEQRGNKRKSDPWGPIE